MFIKKPYNADLTIVVVDNLGVPHVETIKDNASEKMMIVGNNFEIEFPATSEIAILHSLENRKQLICGLDCESGKLISLDKNQALAIADKIRCRA